MRPSYRKFSSRVPDRVLKDPFYVSFYAYCYVSFYVSSYILLISLLILHLHLLRLCLPQPDFAPLATEL